MNADLIRQVWQTAKGRCEYCQLPSSFHPAPFQIDHIVARQHGGTTTIDNLALACIHCNRFNIAGIDQDTGEIVRLFHPRRDPWTKHFGWEGARLMGWRPIGQVTIAVLHINDPEVITVRKALQAEGVFGM